MIEWGVIANNHPLKGRNGASDVFNCQARIRVNIGKRVDIEWNTLELICFENHSVHLVNGKINMAILNAHLKINGKQNKMESGSIQLQSEGAELFIKDVKLRSLKKMPHEIEQFLK